MDEMAGILSHFDRCFRLILVELLMQPTYRWAKFGADEKKGRAALIRYLQRPVPTVREALAALSAALRGRWNESDAH